VPPDIANPDSKVRWNSAAVVLESSDGRLAVLLENRQFLIDDPISLSILRIAQMPHTAAEIIRELCPPDEPVSVRNAAAALVENRILVADQPHSLKRNSRAFWDNISCVGPTEPIAVGSLVPDVAAHVAALLSASGVSVEANARLKVVATDDYLRPEIKTESANAQRFVIAKPIGEEVWIGPCLSEESKLCWECLNYWLRLHRWAELSIIGAVARERLPVSSVAWLPALISAASALIAQAAALISAGAWPYAADLWTFNFRTFEARSFPVAARKNCPNCRPDQRAVSIAALRSPKTGIFEEEAITRRVGPVYLAHARALLALPLPGVRAPVAPVPVDGKGPTAGDALNRCTMEAVERYSSAYTGDEDVIYCRAGEIDAIQPQELLQFSDRQLSGRGEWNARPGSMHGMPERFDPQTPTHWIKARSLTGGRDRYVPAGYAWLWYPFENQPFYNFADTNGCAAGVSLADAGMRAILELIERDALAIWWYNRLERPSVPLGQLDTEQVRSAAGLFEQQNRTLEIFELTNDLRTPVYAAISADANGEEIYIGCAADTCPLSALERSIAELIQFWYWETNLGPGLDRRLWFEETSFTACPFLRTTAEAQIPVALALDKTSALGLCLSALENAGLEAFAVDLTRPELGIPVVRCVVPGLRHYGPRFAPGRLYDVPVEMGWRPKPAEELQLNPCPLIL